MIRDEIWLGPFLELEGILLSTPTTQNNVSSKEK